MKKKLLTILLSVFMIMTLVPVSVLAAEVDWSMFDGTYNAHVMGGGDVVGTVTLSNSCETYSFGSNTSSKVKIEDGMLIYEDGAALTYSNDLLYFYDNNGNAYILTIDIKQMIDKAVGGFPTTPENGWSNENGVRAYASEDDFYLYIENTEARILSTSETLTGSNEFAKGVYTLVFNLENGKLISINLSIAGTDNPEVNGTYSAPITIADILPDDFPNNADDNTWCNSENDNVCIYKTDSNLVFNDSTEDCYSVPLSSPLTKEENTTVSYKYLQGDDWIQFNMTGDYGDELDSIIVKNCTNASCIGTYAYEAPEAFSVTYNANGATSGTVPANQTKTAGVGLTLATNTGNLAKTDYTFAGWNTKDDGSGIHYDTGATYTTDAALTLYAEWIEAPATKTIADILPNDFPTLPTIGDFDYNRSIIPSSAWVKTNIGEDDYDRFFLFILDNKLCLVDLLQSNWSFSDLEISQLNINLDGEGNYVSSINVKTGEMPSTISFKFTMNDGALKSITVSGYPLGKYYSIWLDGTYIAPTLPKTIADILPEDFPTTKQDGWVNQSNGTSLYLSSDSLLHTNDSFNVSKKSTIVSDGLNFKTNKLEDFTIDFIMSGLDLSYIEITGYNQAHSVTNVDGIYKTPKILADILPEYKEFIKNDNPTIAYRDDDSLELVLLSDYSYKCFENIGPKIVTPVFGKQHQYELNASGVLFKFKVNDEGKVNSFEVEGLENEYAIFNGTYSLPLTIADIMPEDFPVIVENAWKNNNNKTLYLDEGYMTLDIEYLYIYLNQPVYKETSGNYYSMCELGTLTFVMDDDVFTSVEITDFPSPYDSYNGAYVSPKSKINPSVSLTGWTYGDNPNAPTVTGNTGNGTVTYQYKEIDAEDNTYTSVVPTKVGSYVVKAKIAETSEYRAGSATSDFTISQRQLEVIGTTLKDKAYDGTTIADFENKGSLTNVVSDDEVTLDAIATYADTNAGEDKSVTVTYTTSGADASNYIKPINNTSLTSTINKADMVFGTNYLTPCVPYFPLEYDGQSHNLLECGLTWDEKDDSEFGTFYYSTDGTNWSQDLPTAIAAGEYNPLWYFVGDNNHKNVGSVEEPVTQLYPVVISSSSSLTLSSIEKQVYTGSEIKPTVVINGLTNSETLTLDTDYTVTYTDNINVGTATATVTLLNTDKAKNYKFNEDANKVTFNIARKPIAVPTAETGLAYTGTVLTGVKEGTGYTLSNNKQTNAGDYIAVATLDSNHKWENEESLANKEVQWTVAKANQDAPAINVGYILDYFNETLIASNGYEISSTKTATATPLTDNKVEPGTTYYVRKLGDNNHYVSNYSEIVLPNRPGTVTGVEAHQETIMKKDDAALRGVTSSMEYSMSINDGEYGKWIQGTGYSIGMTFDSNPPVTKRDVKVRYMATDTSFAGEETTYTFLPSTNKITVTFFEVETKEVPYGILDKPNDPTKEGYAFGGWYMDVNYKEAWNFASNIVMENITLYPKWIANSVVSAKISGNVTENSIGVPNATVELYLGTIKIATTTTNTSGQYSFNNVEKGTYNIVVTKADGSKTKTELVTIETSGTKTIDVVLPTSSVNSIVEHTGNDVENAKSNINQTVVGGLDEIAELQTPTGTDKITIKLKVEPKKESDVDSTTVVDIKQKAGNGKKVEFIDMSLYKQINNGNEESIGNDNEKILTIVIPFDFTNTDVNSVMIIRKHGNDTVALNKGSSNAVDGEYFEVDEANGTITIYAKRFSDYAIAYSNIGSNPSSDPMPRYRVPNTGVDVTPTSNHSLLKLSSLSLLAIGICLVIKKKIDND